MQSVIKYGEANLKKQGTNSKCNGRELKGGITIARPRDDSIKQIKRREKVEILLTGKCLHKSKSGELAETSCRLKHEKLSLGCCLKSKWELEWLQELVGSHTHTTSHPYWRALLMICQSGAFVLNSFPIPRLRGCLREGGGYADEEKSSLAATVSNLHVFKIMLVSPFNSFESSFIIKSILQSKGPDKDKEEGKESGQLVYCQIGMEHLACHSGSGVVWTHHEVDTI